jgi:hypothetical protein
MPFVSKAQQRWGHTASGEKALGGPSAVEEWDHATDFRNLPVKTHEVTGKGGKSFKVKEGALHSMLHVPQDEKIGEERMRKASHSSNPLLRKRAISGLGLSHMRHGD